MATLFSPEHYQQGVIGMSESYLELKRQADDLLAKAEAARKEEYRGVLEQIVGLISAYDIKLTDIARVLDKTVPATTVRAAKYRDPASGKTWNGHGRAPGWMPSDKTQWERWLA